MPAGAACPSHVLMAALLQVNTFRCASSTAEEPEQAGPKKAGLSFSRGPESLGPSLLLLPHVSRTLHLEGVTPHLLHLILHLSGCNVARKEGGLMRYFFSAFTLSLTRCQNLL